MAKLLFACKMSMGYSVVMLVLILLVLLLQDHLVCGKPYNLWSSYQALIPTSETDCDQNDAIETLCQRCAKQTKSTVVYPMCCRNTEEAREWCQKYMNFGLQ